MDTGMKGQTQNVNDNLSFFYASDGWSVDCLDFCCCCFWYCFANCLFVCYVNDAFVL